MSYYNQAISSPETKSLLQIFLLQYFLFHRFRPCGWKDGRDAHIDDHPVADNEDFPVFPQLRAIWLPKQCNVTAGSTSWLISKFLPNNLRTTGVIANPAPRQFFFRCANSTCTFLIVVCNGHTYCPAYVTGPQFFRIKLKVDQFCWNWSYSKWSKHTP